MGLFSALTGVVIETAKLPLAVVRDAFTLGNVAEDKTFTQQKLEDIKDEAEKADE